MRLEVLITKNGDYESYIVRTESESRIEATNELTSWINRLVNLADGRVIEWRKPVSVEGYPKMYANEPPMYVGTARFFVRKV